jgi:hypothetical protein
MQGCPNRGQAESTQGQRMRCGDTASTLEQLNITYLSF